MNIEKKLEILNAEEGEYTPEYLNEVFDEQYAVVKKVADYLTAAEMELLLATMNECKREFWKIASYITAEEMQVNIRKRYDEQQVPEEKWYNDIDSDMWEY